MLIRKIKRSALKSLGASALLIGLSSISQAQVVGTWSQTPSHSHPVPYCPQMPGYYPGPPSSEPGSEKLPSMPGTGTPGTPGTTDPGTTTPGTGTTPGSGMTPGSDMSGISDAGGGAGDTGLGASAFGGESASAVGGGQQSYGLYIDSGEIRNQVRLRYDAQYNFRRPDRGEFFYPKCGCFRVAGVDPSADGPPLMETNIDSNQEARAYLEYAFAPTLSTFVEIPFRFLNPEQNANTAGLGDVIAGVKYGLVNCADRLVTFQVKGYFPTGDGDRGLGTQHYSVEPAILFLQKLSDRMVLEGEVRDWIGIQGSDFTGNVLRYGLGLGVIAYNTCNFRIVPVVEVVGWTFLDGLYSTAAGAVVDARGDTIVNGKAGVRFGFGQVAGPGLLSNTDLGVSYGRALTGDVLYEDIVRVELRMAY